MSELEKILIQVPSLQKIGSELIAPSDALVIGACLVPSGPVQVASSSISHQQTIPVPKQRAHAAVDTGRIEQQLIIEMVYPQELIFSDATQAFDGGRVFLSLDQLLRQLDLTPFVPIYHEGIAKLLGSDKKDYVWCVVQSVRIYSIDDQPGQVGAQIQLLKTNMETVAGGLVHFKDQVGKLYTYKDKMYRSEMIRKMISDRLAKERVKNYPAGDRLIVSWQTVVSLIQRRVNAYISSLQTLAAPEVLQQLADIRANLEQSLKTIEKVIEEHGQAFDLGEITSFEAQYQNYLVPHALLSEPSVFHQYMGQTGWQIRLSTVCDNEEQIRHAHQLREKVAQLVLVANDFINHVPVELQSRLSLLLDVKYPFILTFDVNSLDEQVGAFLVNFQLLDTTNLYEMEKLIDVSETAQYKIIADVVKQKPYLYLDLIGKGVNASPGQVDFKAFINLQTPTRKDVDALVDYYLSGIARLANEKLAGMQLAAQLLDLSVYDTLDVKVNDITDYVERYQQLVSDYTRERVDRTLRWYEARSIEQRSVQQQILSCELDAARTKPSDLRILQDQVLNQYQNKQPVYPTQYFGQDPHAIAQATLAGRTLRNWLMDRAFAAQVQLSYGIRDAIGPNKFDSSFEYSLRDDLQSLLQLLINNSVQLITSDATGQETLQGFRRLIQNAHPDSLAAQLRNRHLAKLSPEQRDQVLHQQFCIYLKLVEQTSASRWAAIKIVRQMTDDVNSLPTLPKLSRFGMWLDGSIAYISLLIELMLQVMTEEIQRLLESYDIDLSIFTEVPFQLDVNLSDIFTAPQQDRYSWVYELLNRQAEVHQQIRDYLRTEFPGNIRQIMNVYPELKSAKVLAFMDVLDYSGTAVIADVERHYDATGQSQPVSTPIDTVQNTPQSKDLSQFQELMKQLEQQETIDERVGLDSVFRKLNQMLQAQSADGIQLLSSVLAFNTVDYSQSIVYEAMYNLLNTQYDIDYLTPNQQILFIYRHDIQPFLYPQSTGVITYNSIQQLQIVKQKENPIHVANILLTNMTGVLDPSSQIQLAIYRKETFENRSVYRLFLKPGVEIAIRLGYSRRIARLPIAFQGFIQSVQQTNNLVHIVAEGYGALLTRQVFEKSKRIGGMASNPIELVYEAVLSTNARHLGITGFFETLMQNIQQIQLQDELATSYTYRRWFAIARTTDQFVNVYQPTEYYKGYGPDYNGVFRNFETWFCEYNARPGDSQWKLIRDQVDMMPGYVFGLVDYGIGQQRVFYGRPFDPAKFTRTPLTELQLKNLTQLATSTRSSELQNLEKTVAQIVPNLYKLPDLALNPTVAGQVVGVVDGDTVDVHVGAAVVRVRLIGVNTPEQNEAGFAEAKQYTETHLLGRTVYLELDKSTTDPYGRTLAYVWLKLPARGITADDFVNNLYNQQLLLAKHAVVMTVVPNVKYQHFYEAIAQNDVKAKLLEWYNAQLQILRNEYQLTKRQYEASKANLDAELSTRVEVLLQQLDPDRHPLFGLNPTSARDAVLLMSMYQHGFSFTDAPIMTDYLFQLRRLSEVISSYSTVNLQATRQQMIVENTKRQIEESRRTLLEFQIRTRSPFQPDKSLQYRDIYRRAVILGTRPFQSIFPVSSEVNLLDNQVRLSTQQIANEVILYSAPFFQDWIFLIRFFQWLGNKLTGSETLQKFRGRNYTITRIILDDNIPDEYKFPVLELADYAEVQQQKVLVGTSKLMSHLQQMYVGELTVIGNPTLKPHDRIVLMDSLNNMSGWQVVRNVVHRFDTQVGFITQFEIEPEIEVRDLHVSTWKQFQGKALMAQIGIAPLIAIVFGAGFGTLVAQFALQQSLGRLLQAGLAKYFTVSPKYKYADSESSGQQVSLTRVVNPIIVKPLMKSGMLYFAGLEGARYSNQAVGFSGLVEDARRGFEYMIDGIRQFGAQFSEGWYLLTRALQIAANDMQTAGQLQRTASQLLSNQTEQ